MLLIIDSIYLQVSNWGEKGIISNWLVECEFAKQINENIKENTKKNKQKSTKYYSNDELILLYMCNKLVVNLEREDIEKPLLMVIYKHPK